jgi:hypothetical protein
MITDESLMILADHADDTQQYIDYVSIILFFFVADIENRWFTEHEYIVLLMAFKDAYARLPRRAQSLGMFCNQIIKLLVRDLTGTHGRRERVSTHSRILGITHEPDTMLMFTEMTSRPSVVNIMTNTDKDWAGAHGDPISYKSPRVSRMINYARKVSGIMSIDELMYYKESIFLLYSNLGIPLHSQNRPEDRMRECRAFIEYNDYWLNHGKVDMLAMRTMTTIMISSARAYNVDHHQDERYYPSISSEYSSLEALRALGESLPLSVIAMNAAMGDYRPAISES